MGLPLELETQRARCGETQVNEAGNAALHLYRKAINLVSELMHPLNKCTEKLELPAFVYKSVGARRGRLARGARRGGGGGPFSPPLSRKTFPLLSSS